MVENEWHYLAISIVVMVAGWIAYFMGEHELIAYTVGSLVSMLVMAEALLVTSSENKQEAALQLMCPLVLLGAYIASYAIFGFYKAGGLVAIIGGYAVAYLLSREQDDTDESDDGWAAPDGGYDPHDQPLAS